MLVEVNLVAIIVDNVGTSIVMLYEYKPSLKDVLETTKSICGKSRVIPKQ